ncbi:hypothetical protein, partial [Acidiphilium sp. PM]|uniref:hypothetical protein n=1 Tax=Acidiphilium sp. PM TaxID=1043206 RepID=UPI0002144614
DKVIPWDRFCSTVMEAETLVRSEDFDPYEVLSEHYAGIRRWAPAFLATFEFQGDLGSTKRWRLYGPRWSWGSRFAPKFGPVRHMFEKLAENEPTR